jgi:hypothetical protein
MPTTASAAGGLSLGQTSSLPEQLVPGDLGSVAGTGTRFVAETSATHHDQYTPDNGKTWQPVPAAFDADTVSDRIGYGGTFAAMSRGEDADGYWVVNGFRRWDPVTGAVTVYPYDLGDAGGDDSEGFRLVDYVGTVGMLNDGRVFAFSGGTVTPLHPAWPVTPALYGQDHALSRDGAMAVRAGVPLHSSTGYLSVARTDGSGGAVALQVPGLLAMDVSASTIHYLVHSSTRLKLCKALVTSPKVATCRTVATGDFRGSRIEDAVLSTSAGADQVTVWRHGAGGPHRWLVTGRRSARVPSSWDWLPLRDTVKPMARTYSKAAHLWMASTLSASGKATPLFSAPPAPAQTGLGTLSAGRITYVRESYARSTGIVRTVQYRTLEAGDYGPPVRLTSRSVTALQASAGRTAVQWDNTDANHRQFRVVFYDGATKTGSYLPTKKRTWLGELSGPYAIVNNLGVVRADGRVVSTRPTVAIFGSLVVEASAAQPAPGRTFTVRDLARPAAAAVPVALPQVPGRTYQNDLQLWGDWVAAPFTLEGALGGAVALNYRTQQVIEFPAGTSVTGLGDGWVALSANGRAPVVQVLATGESLAVPVEDPETYGGEVGTDELRTVIWPGGEDGRMLVAEVRGLPTSAPRLLGTLASGSFRATGTHTWKPRFDLSKAVAAGRLELRNAAGTLVRTLVTKGSAFGSIRGVSWDGRDDAGTRVPAGTYTWTPCRCCTCPSGCSAGP